MNNTQLLANRFEIQGLLGRGGMGDVYRARDTQTGETVAVKALNPEVLEGDLSMLERFIREGEALRQLNHPNIVKMLTAFEENGRYYLVMEYVAGGSLQDLLSSNGKLPHERVGQISLDLADALTRAHRLGIIHRDIKPANVLLAEDGTPRLADFGIAHLSNVSSLTQTGIAIGSIDYLSPEACRGEMPDERTDIWSFGVMLFQLLAGEKPFKGDSMVAKLNAILTQKIPDLSQLAPNTPDALVDLVYRMLEKDFQQRIPSVRLVGAELEAILKGREPVTPSRVSDEESRFETPTPSTTVSKHNLPTQTTPFVGREEELRELSRLLADPSVRLLTVLGVGGMGKTRLAIEAGREQIDRFERGAYFVPLAGLESVEAIVPAIAKSLDFSFYEGGEPRQQLLDYLCEKNLLLIMDNFEHLLEGVSLVSEILQNATKVKVLATSRMKLNLQDEHIFHLEGMDFPDWETPEDAMKYSAVKLFLQSARRAKPGFELLTDDLKYVARICKLVGGMPLGILLAAAWIEMLTLEEVAKEIEQSVDFLETSLSDIPERQRSMRAVFDYAWKLLNEKEQKVLRGLSVFRGGFTREAAQDVTGATLRDLMSLVDKSLLHRALSGRYDVHALLGQYANVKLVESGEEKTIRDRHRDWFLDLAERAAPELTKEAQLEWQERVEKDLENIRVAMKWTLKKGDAEPALRLAGALAEILDDYREIQPYLEKSLALADGLDHLRQSKWRANVLLSLGWNTIPQSDFSLPNDATQKLHEALDIYRHLDSKADIAAALSAMAYVTYFFWGDLEKAISTANEAIDIARVSGDHFQIGLALNNLANCFVSRNPVRSKDLYEESLKHMRVAGDRRLMAIIAGNLIASETSLGNVSKARDLAEEVLSLSRKLKYQNGVSRGLRWVGWLSCGQGNYKEAFECYQQALPIAREINFKVEIATCLWELGRLNFYHKDYEQAFNTFHEGLQISNEMQDTKRRALFQTEMGFICLVKNNFIEANELFGNNWKTVLDGFSNMEAADALRGWGDSTRLQGKLAESLEHYHQAIGLIKEADQAFTLEYVLEGIAKTLSEMSDYEKAGRLFGAATSVRKKWGGVIHPVFRAEYDKYTNLLREKLGNAAFESLWKEGEAMSIEQAIELALQEEQTK